jgi:hypothetical protein
VSPAKDGKWQYAKPKPTPGKVCRDCKEAGRPLTRPAPHPGPRCTTDWNTEKRRKRLARSVKHVERTYGLTDAEYNALYEFQGGRCALCRRATGASKRLAVDHDHTLARQHGHPEGKGCRECSRGLLCATCNDVVAHARDDAAYGRRLAAYLIQWPMTWMLRKLSPSWPPFATGDRV